jgi:predicted TIM-barrel fold metal-dependent hydrolase
VLPLAQNCTKLEELDLSGYTQLQPDAVLALIQHFAHLRRLVLDHCACITDATLLSVAAQGVISLKELSLKNCPSVTAEGVAAFPTAERSRLQSLLRGVP